MQEFCFGIACVKLLDEVNTIPLQLQINFIELREDICGLWQPLPYGGGNCAMFPLRP